MPETVIRYRRVFLERTVDPCCGQPEGRLGGVRARQLHLAAGRIHDHVLSGPHFATAGLNFLDLDDIRIRIKLHVVENADGGHDKSHLDGKRTSQSLDLLGETIAAVRRIHQREQCVAELDLQVVHLESGCDRLIGAVCLGRGFCFLCLSGGGRAHSHRCPAPEMELLEFRAIAP